MSAEATDAELFGLAREDGPRAKSAYAELVLRHQSSAVRLATYLLASNAEAEDLAQEAFVRAFLRIREATPDTTFGPWLRTILTRLCFNHRRDARARQKTAGADDEPGRTNVPSSARSAVEWTLAQLSYPYREILVLRFVEEMTVLEIAEALSLGESAVKMRLTRARDRFHEVFAGEHATPKPMAAAEDRLV